LSEYPIGRAAGAAQSGAWEAIHATALVIGEAGVIIRGPSGSGKSALTLALLSLAADRKVFAALIGDDRVSICAKNQRIVATGAPDMRGLIERRGYGIVTAPSEPYAIVRLIADLLPQGRRSERLPDEDALNASLAGVTLPRVIFDGESGPFERAYAMFGCLDKIGDKIMTGFAHFA
jgi:HPr kinase/phosphorylase